MAHRPDWLPLSRVMAHRRGAVVCSQERERLQAVVAAAKASRAFRSSSTSDAERLHGNAEPSADPPSETAAGSSAAAEAGTPEPVPLPLEPTAAQDSIGAPPQPTAPPEPPRMALQEAVTLVQAAERGRQARERVAALQLARRRNDARQRIRAAGTVGLDMWQATPQTPRHPQAIVNGRQQRSG